MPCNCKDCPLNGQPKVGPTACKSGKLRYIIVAESPGNKEAILGQVLVGPSGNKLDQLLASAGISRDDCYLTNVIKCLPTDKRGKKEAAACCLPGFLEELETVPCDEILAFGEISAHALTGDCTPINSWHGYVYPGPFNKRVHVFYHPAFALPSRRPAIAIPIIEDLRHAVFEGPSLRPLQDTPTISLERLKEADVVTIDVENKILDRLEADPRKDELVLIGAGTPEGALNVHWPLQPGEEQTWAIIREKLLDQRVIKVGQNFTHDILSLKYRAGTEVRGKCEDTMIAHASAFPQLDHDLGNIYAQYFWNERWKNFAEDNFELYNRCDVYRTANVWPRVKESVHIAYPACDRLYRQAVHLDLDIARHMREVGILTDSAERDRLRVECTNAKDAARKAFESLCPGVSLGSAGDTGAVKNLFFKTLRVQELRNQGAPIAFTDGGELALRGDLLRWLKASAPTPGVRKISHALLEYKKLAKILSTYLNGKWVDEDGTTHPNIASAWRTVTGRWAFRRPNLQNIPKLEMSSPYAADHINVRRMYRARPGKVLVEADYKQIELWFQALYSADREMLKWHDEGVDIHTVNAERMFGKSDDKAVAKNKRNAAKNAAYGLFYNYYDDVSAVLAAFWKKNIEYSKAEVERIRNEWFRIRPAFKQGQRSLVAVAEANGFAESWDGRREYYYGGEVDKNQAINFPIQASVGDMVNKAVERVDRTIDWDTTCLLAQVHDSLIIETIPEQVQWVCGMLKEVMEQTVEIRGHKLLFGIDCKVGDNMGEMHAVE